MNARFVLILCASALVIQSALGQCAGRLGAGFSRCGGCGYGGCGYSGCGYSGLGYGGYGGRLGGGHSAFYGGGLGVASASAVPAVGLGVTSQNVYEGCLEVAGNLPFIGTVGVEGVFPTAGTGVINYGCGDGAVGITAEGGYGAGLGDGAGYGAGYGHGLGYGGYGHGGCGCGCGGSYIC